MTPSFQNCVRPLLETCHPERSEGSAVGGRQKSEAAGTNLARAFSLCVCLIMLHASRTFACEVINVQVYPAVNAPVLLRLTENGKPLNGARIEMYLGQPSPTNDLPFEILSTKSDGTAVTSELSVALFHLVVYLEDVKRANFTLDVPLEGEMRATDRGLVLISTPIGEVDSVEAAPAVRGPIMAKPLQASVRQFHGVVADITGAVIPNSDIKIYIQGNIIDPPITRLHTDGGGEFAAELNRGKYTAVFNSPGFVIQPLDFAIDADGWKSLRLTLQLSGCGHAQGVIAEN